MMFYFLYDIFQSKKKRKNRLIKKEKKRVTFLSFFFDLMTINHGRAFEFYHFDL